jgi:F-type H+-transporting ATPase subunit b
MTGRRWYFLASSLLATLLLSALRAHAEEGGAANDQANELFKWINFAILAGMVIWVFVKILPPKFRKNAESISSAITQATATKAEADRQLKEAEGKLARLDQELAQLRAVAKEEAAAEAERIRQTTQNDAQKIDAAAKAEIEAAQRAARLQLKSIAANLAVDGAESLLARELTPQAQESLVAAFVETLEARPN